MKNWILFTSLAIVFSSLARANESPREIAMAYQELLNAGNIELAMDYWLPQNAAQFKKDNGVVLTQLFGNIDVIKDTVYSNCNISSCKVVAKFRNQDNELRQVVYSFESENNLKLINVQTRGLGLPLTL